MKRLILLLSMFFVLGNVFAQNKNSDLESANKYYEATDFASAETLFKKAIISGVENGVIFYRLGYSLENTKTDKTLMEKSYKASVFCFERDSETSNAYYAKAKRKLVQHNLENDFSEDSLKLLKKGLNGKKELFNPKDDILTNLLNLICNLNKNIKIILIILAVIVYIIAWFLSTKTENCIIVFTWFDMIFLAISGSILCMCLYNIHNGGKIEDTSTISFVFTISFLISMFYSFIANIGNSFPENIIYILISILTKVVLVFVVPITIVMILCSFDSGKKDKRYKDGTKNNNKTFLVSLLFALVAFLISPLVKTHKNSRISKTVENFSDENYTSEFFQRWNKHFH